MEKIKLLVADDHTVLRKGIVSLLEEEFKVIAEADNGQDAVDLALNLKPDIVLIDITMPVLNGIEATRLIKNNAPEIGVLTLSMHAENSFVTEIFQAGANGYILKMCDFSELVTAIRTVAQGGSYVSPQVAGSVIKELSNTPQGQSDTKILSEREKEILILIAEGKSSKEIANNLFLSIKTIDTHKRQIMQKLNTDSIAMLIKYAIKHGLSSLD